MEKKLEKIVEELGALTVLEMSQLKSALEETWGVEAATGGGVVMAAPAADGADAATEEATEFNVTLTSIDATKKIAAIKEVRAATGLGLKEAKDICDTAPKLIKEGVDKKTADELKTKLEAAGCKVECKPV